MTTKTKPSKSPGTPATPDAVEGCRIWRATERGHGITGGTTLHDAGWLVTEPGRPWEPIAFILYDDNEAGLVKARAQLARDIDEDHTLLDTIGEAAIDLRDRGRKHSTRELPPWLFGLTLHCREAGKNRSLPYAQVAFCPVLFRRLQAKAIEMGLPYSAPGSLPSDAATQAKYLNYRPELADWFDTPEVQARTSPLRFLIRHGDYQNPGPVIATVDISPAFAPASGRIIQLVTSAPDLWRQLREIAPQIENSELPDSFGELGEITSLLTYAAGRAPFEMRKKHDDDEIYLRHMNAELAGPPKQEGGAE